MKKLQLSIHYIQELKYRLAYSGIGTALFFSISYKYKQTLIYLIIPKGISHFISTDLTEIFTIYLHLCFTLSFIGGTIILILQLYLFIRPGLYLNEAKKSYVLIVTTINFYILMYIVVLPLFIQVSWEFFLEYTNSFNSIQLIFDPQLKNYLNYIYKLSAVINYSYPLVILLNIYISQAKKIALTGCRRITYFAAFTAAAILTPPDIISQTLIGLFFIILYETQIILWLVYKKYDAELK